MKKAIMVASIHEAALLIKSLNLKAINSKITTFENDEYVLAISGIGKLNSAITTSHILTKYNVDTILNFGIAGAKKDIEIGSIYLINKIVDDTLKKEYYPDILLSHPFKESCITTYDKAITDSSSISTDLVDMECSSYYFASSKYLPPHKISTIKIVSDHFEPSIISKEYIDSLISPHLDTIIEYIDNYSFEQNRILSDEENSIIEKISSDINLSFNQNIQLIDKAKYLKLNNSFDKLKEYTVTKIESKQQREREFAKIKSIQP
jgi:hypothetical protein